MVQRRERDIPPAVQGPEQVVRGHRDVVEEDLAERLVGDRRHPDGLDAHPGRPQVEDETRNPAVFGGFGVGAGIQGAPARLVGLRGPDLVPVDPEHLSVGTTAFGARAQAGEVGPGLRLGHAQRPPLVAAQQGDQQPVDLGLCAELADARGGHVGAGDVGQLGCRAHRRLEPHFHRVAQTQRPPAVLAWPGGLYPAALEGGPLVVAPQNQVPAIGAIVLVVVPGQKLRQPRPEFGYHRAHSAPPAKRRPTSW